MPNMMSGHLTGVVQKAARSEDSIEYAGPCALGFSTQLYKDLGSPSFWATKENDVAGEVTQKCYDKGVPVKLLRVTSCDIPKWPLANGKMFGIGTTYGNSIYHQYEVRHHGGRKFIDKCDEVLAGRHRLNSIS